jgi:hypothetical protein
MLLILNYTKMKLSEIKKELNNNPSSTTNFDNQNIYRFIVIYRASIREKRNRETKVTSESTPPFEHHKTGSSEILNCLKKFS